MPLCSRGDGVLDGVDLTLVVAFRLAGRDGDVDACSSRAAFLAPFCMATKNGLVESLVISETAILPPAAGAPVAPGAVVPPGAAVPDDFESLPHAARANAAARPRAITVRMGRLRLDCALMAPPRSRVVNVVRELTAGVRPLSRLDSLDKWC